METHATYIYTSKTNDELNDSVKDSSMNEQAE